MRDVITLYFIAVSSYVFARMLQEPLLDTFKLHGLVMKNFREKSMPFLGGIIIVCAGIVGLCAAYILLVKVRQEVLVFLLSIVLIAVISIKDDFSGSQDKKGFKGHLETFLKESRLTTGMLKAITGGLIAAGVSILYSHTLFEFVINSLMVALITNLLNLFDLRPGRAIKVFLFLSFGLLAMRISSLPANLLLIIVAPSVAFLPFDLGEEAMLGDVGSNVLGISIGLIALWTLPIYLKTVIVPILLYLHWYAETRSFSQLIKSQKFLYKLDQLGRE